MNDDSAVRELAPARPKSPTTLIGPAGSSLQFGLKELAGYGELLYFLVWRDIKVRYKQTAIGSGWAVLQPMMTMLIFTAVFSGLANVPSDGMPYPLFAYTGLLPWTYFAAAMTRSGNSLVSNSNLITKVYFPRLIIPLSAILSPLVDVGIAAILLVAMMLWFQVAPTPAIVLIPFFLLLCGLTAFAVSLWLSALCVRYRDVSVVIPFLVQIWMYASPVAYPASLVPERWRALYAINPMVGVIEGFRWGFLGTRSPDALLVGISVVMVAVLMCGGLLYFNRVQRVFADVV
jgi:lipopolysaccharide transport system permease protein